MLQRSKKQPGRYKELNMASTTKSNPENPSGAQAAGEQRRRDGKITVPFAEMIQKGLEQYVDTQKKALDSAARQSAAAGKAFKESLRLTGSAPAAVFADCAGDIVARLVDSQKEILDLAAKQAEIAAKAGEFSNSRLANGMADTVEQHVEGVAASQKAVLDFAARQNAVALEAFRKQAEAVEGGEHVAAFADSMRQAVEGYVELQKKFVDASAKHGIAQWSAARQGKLPLVPPINEFADAARKGLDTIVETQKRLYDIAFQGVGKAAAAD
jgi:hypothetical protein